MQEFAGDDRVVGDYLLAEVLDRQPPRLRSFLLRTSLVDRVSGELADALIGRSSSGDILSDLERTNGFVIGVDSRREWYRYHRLFAKLLRTRARRELGAELPVLHARAARWYAARGMGSEALEHAVAAEEWDLAVELVAEHWFDLFVRGRGDAIRALVDVLPPDRLRVRRGAQRGARVRGVRGRAHRSGRGAPRAGARRREPRCRPSAAGATSRRSRSRGCTAPVWTGTSRPRSTPRTSCSPRPPSTAAGPTTPVTRSCARSSAVPRCGRASTLARARSSSRGSRQARAAGLDYVVISAQSALGLLTVMEDGPVGGDVRPRGGRAGRTARLVDDVRDGLRTRGARARLVLRPAPGGGGGASRARPRRRQPRPRPARRVRARPPGGAHGGRRRPRRRGPADPRRLHRHAPLRDAQPVRGPRAGQHARAAVRRSRRHRGRPRGAGVRTATPAGSTSR